MRKGILYTLCMYAFIFTGCSDSDNESNKTFLDINTESILLKEEGGTAYLNIASNTKWTILVENEDVPVPDLEVTPLSGDGDGTIKITYGSEANKMECEYANLIFYYYSEGERVSKSVLLTRNEKGGEDEDIWNYMVSILRYDKKNQSFTSNDGWKIKSDITYWMNGTIYVTQYKYLDSMVDEESKTITVQFLSEPVCIDASTHIGDIGYFPSDAPCYDIIYEDFGPTFYDDNILIVPIIFWVRDEDDLKKHSFELICDPSEKGQNLKLHLRHIIPYDEGYSRNKYTVQYRAFDLQYLFEQLGKPDKITIEYEKNPVNDNWESAKTATYTLNTAVN